MLQAFHPKDFSFKIDISFHHCSEKEGEKEAFEVSTYS